MTKNRKLLLDIIRREPVHHTAAELYELASAEAPGISVATVYNNLGALSEGGYIRRLHIDGQSDRYDRSTDPHVHFICDGCNRISDIFYSDCVTKLAGAIGATVSSYELNIRGICAACQKIQK